jgi:hypothetical protein
MQCSADTYNIARMLYCYAIQRVNMLYHSHTAVLLYCYIVKLVKVLHCCSCGRHVLLFTLVDQLCMRQLYNEQLYALSNIQAHTHVHVLLLRNVCI